MDYQIKQVQGKLYELRSENLLGEGLVIIYRHQESSDSAAVYQATITLPGHRMELDGKSCLLRLHEDIAGEVIVNVAPHNLMEHSPSEYKKTLLNVVFPGPGWYESGWFQALR